MCADWFMKSIHPKILEKQRKIKLYHLEKKVTAREQNRSNVRQERLDEAQTIRSHLGSSDRQRHGASFETDNETNVVVVDQVYSTKQNVVTNSVVEDYENACRFYSVLPLTCIEQGLLRTTLTCKSFYLNDNDCRAICEALSENNFVQRLNFQDNNIGSYPALHFADVIQNSKLLTHIRLADNDLKSEGIKVVCKAVSMNPKIVGLDLSGNGLIDSDGVYIRRLLKDSNTLRELYLARNQLMNAGVKQIVKGLKCTSTLNILDLSWNHIRLKGATAICETLKDNGTLQYLNLAWNGLSKAGAISLSVALKKNTTLRELDITCNRLSEYCIAAILKGLEKNTTLEILRLGLNHVSPKAAFSILEKVHDIKTSSIKLLDLGNQEVYDEFENLYKQLQIERDITVTYGSVWSSDRASFAERSSNDKELVLLSCNPLTVLMEFMRLQNMRLIDFFNWLDTNNDRFICIDELCGGMVNAGIPFQRKTLVRLLNKLDLDKNNMLDFKEMTAAFSSHKENVRKVLAENEGLELEDTEIGKISSIIRVLMDRRNAAKRAEYSEKTKRRRSMFARSMSFMKKDRGVPVAKGRRFTLESLTELADDSEIYPENSVATEDQVLPHLPKEPSLQVVNANTMEASSTFSSGVVKRSGDSLKLSEEQYGKLLKATVSSREIRKSTSRAQHLLSAEKSSIIGDAVERPHRPGLHKTVDGTRSLLSEASKTLPDIQTKHASLVSKRGWESTW